MHKLVKYELKKISTYATILILLFLLLANAIMAIKASKKKEYEDQIKNLYIEYTTDADVATRWKEYYEDIESKNELIEKAWWDQVMNGIKEPLQTYDPCLISGSEDATDREILSELFEKEQAVKELSEYYRSISIQAEENRLELLQEGKSEKDLAVVMQQKTRDRYQALANKINVDFTYPSGWDQYFSYQAVDIFIFLFVLWAASKIFAQENRFHTNPVLISSPNGHLRTSTAKLLTMLIIIVFTTIVFVAETFLIFSIRLEFSSFSCGIQLLEGFRLVPLAITVGEYWALSVFSKFLTFYSFSCIVLLVSIFTGSSLVSFIAGAGFYGINWLFWGWNYVGTPRTFYYLNMISTSHFVEVSERYKLIGFGTSACSTIALAYLLPLFILILVVGAISCVFFFKKTAMPQLHLRKISWIKGKRAIYHLKKSLKKIKISSKKKGIWQWEFYKNLIAKKRCLIILGIVLFKVFSSFFLTEFPLYSQVILKEYAERWEGIVTQEKLDEINGEKNFVNNILKGEYPTDNLEENIALYEYARGHQEAIVEFSQRVNNLWETQKETGIPCYILYDCGWENLFNQKADMLLYAAILILLCGIFSSEHGKESANGNIYALLRSTPKGRTKTFCSKISIALFLSVSLSVLFVVLDIIKVSQTHSLNFSSATLISLTSFGNMDISITIGTYLVVWCFLRIISTCFLAFFTVACSELTRSSVGATLLTIFFTLTPTILISFGFSDFYQVAFLDLFSVTPLIINSFTLKNRPLVFLASHLAISMIVSSLLLFIALEQYNKCIIDVKFTKKRNLQT